MDMFNPAEISDKNLQEYDEMMLEYTTKTLKSSALADAIWGSVLKALDQRGKVTLIKGSYDDIGNALVRRNY